MEKNEEEMKEVKEEIKEVKEEIAKIEKEIDTIRAIFGKYSSDQWDSLRLTSSFREQVEPEFYKFGQYSFDELILKKSKLQDQKNKFLDEGNLLLSKEILLLRKTEPGIKPFHFFTINDI
jgi:hypothetical protein